MFFLIFPEIDRTGVLQGSGIRYIEEIAEPVALVCRFQYRNAAGTAFDISMHALIPEVVFRTGGGFRTLCEDHELVIETIFVHARGGREKGSPSIWVFGQFQCNAIGHFRIDLYFIRDRKSSFQIKKRPEGRLIGFGIQIQVLKKYNCILRIKSVSM